MLRMSADWPGLAMFPDQFASFAIKRLYDVAGVDQINNAVIDQRSWLRIPFVHIPDPFKGRLPRFLVDLIKWAARMSIVLCADASASRWAGSCSMASVRHKRNGVFGVACDGQSFGGGRFRSLTPATTAEMLSAISKLVSGVRAAITLSTPF